MNFYRFVFIDVWVVYIEWVYIIAIRLDLPVGPNRPDRLDLPVGPNRPDRLVHPVLPNRLDHLDPLADPNRLDLPGLPAGPNRPDRLVLQTVPVLAARVAQQLRRKWPDCQYFLLYISDAVPLASLSVASHNLQEDFAARFLISEADNFD